ARVGERVGLVGGAENGAAPGENAAGVVGRERPGHLWLYQPLVAVLDADELVVELEGAALHHRANQRVQTRAVAPTSQHTESHEVRSKNGQKRQGDTFGYDIGVAVRF